MRLLRIPEAFDHPDFIYEPKVDGFRALAHIDGHRCTLVSRNGHVFTSWPQLAEEIAHGIRVDNAIIDGEICCLEPDGRSNSKKLLFRRDWPFFYAFDVLALNGRDVRALRLLERKRQLRAVMPRVESRVLYLDHFAGRGVELYEAACRHDLEGIVAKWIRGTYQCDGSGTSWLKIKNARYSQMDGRRDLFAARRDDRQRRRGQRAPELRLA